LYRNSTTHKPYNLAIPGCAVLCPLEKFAELLKPVIPVNWEKECRMGILSDDFAFNKLAILGQYLILTNYFIPVCSILLRILQIKGK
jgi:lysosomal acid phosphatase